MNEDFTFKKLNRWRKALVVILWSFPVISLLFFIKYKGTPDTAMIAFISLISLYTYWATRTVIKRDISSLKGLMVLNFLTGNLIAVLIFYWVFKVSRVEVDSLNLES